MYLKSSVSIVKTEGRCTVALQCAAKLSSLLTALVCLPSFWLYGTGKIVLILAKVACLNLWKYLFCGTFTVVKVAFNGYGLIEFCK